MKLIFEDYFDQHTMSVHLKENVEALAKRGKPGEWSLTPVSEEVLDDAKLWVIINEINEYCEENDDGLVEDKWEHAQVIQLMSYRIVIALPPFSNSIEVTIVKPTLQKTLESYNLNPKLFKRLSQETEGILIAGSPGVGKSTFASALANFLAKQNKIVKTIENPRDLTVDINITQYSINKKEQERTGDLLLLMRPDYVIYDELRKSGDFEVFSDLRLAGIGLVGVTHAKKPIDAIQRFLSRTDLGIIPSIINTVLFIHNGKVEKILELQMSVKVPFGMKSDDLSRPVIVVNDFTNNSALYEIYSYGEQVVVIPVNKKTLIKKEYKKKLDILGIERELGNYINGAKCKVRQVGSERIKVYIPQKHINYFIGKNGNNIREIENYLRLSIDVEPLSSFENDYGMYESNIEIEVVINKKELILEIGSKYAGVSGDIEVNSARIIRVPATHSGSFKVSKKKTEGIKLIKQLNLGEIVKFVPDAY